jgi:hypothetical protein
MPVELQILQKIRAGMRFSDIVFDHFLPPQPLSKLPALEATENALIESPPIRLIM